MPKKSGYKHSTGHFKSKKDKKDFDGLFDLIQNLYNLGYSRQEIADVFGYQKSTINGFMTQMRFAGYQIKKLPKKPGTIDRGINTTRGSGILTRV